MIIPACNLSSVKRIKASRPFSIEPPIRPDSAPSQVVPDGSETHPPTEPQADNPQTLISQGWDLFKALKPIDAKDKQAAVRLLNTLRCLLPTLPPSGLLASLLLTQAYRFIKEIPLAASIIWENRQIRFRPEDFERYDYVDPKGRPQQLPSLVEKITRASISIALADDPDPDVRQEKLAWARSMIEAHAARYHDNLWITLDRVKLAIHTGEKIDEAKTLMQTLLHKKPRDFWVWDTTAKLVTDPDMIIACLCRALACPGAKPEFLVNVRTQLARELYKLGLIPEVKCEIEQVVAIRENLGWAIPPAILAFRSKADYQSANCPASNDSLYATYIPKTKDILSLSAMQPRQHPRRPQAEVNTTTGDKCEFSGIVKLHAKGFAFVGDVFISPTLVAANSLNHGDKIAGKAIMAQKEGKAESGWKAVALHK